MITGNVTGTSVAFNNLAGGIWNVGGSNYFGNAAGIANSGTISISGTSYFYAAALFGLSNANQINLQSNSSAFVYANVTGDGTFTIGDRSSLELGGSVAAQPGHSGQTITFAAGGRGTLALDNPSDFHGTISGLAAGDMIDLFGGVFISNATLTSTTLTVTKPDTTTISFALTGVQSEYEGQYTLRRQDRCGAHDVCHDLGTGLRPSATLVPRHRRTTYSLAIRQLSARTPEMVSTSIRRPAPIMFSSISIRVHRFRFPVPARQTAYK